ncbi:MAG: M56 family metallopeptidase [Lachnospiraceae bacterium]|nr:M56 family metallopeptidase [Lachnospiraceae bacterium]
MGLLQMSLYGTIMILAVVLIRTVAVNRLPKRTFVVLWCVVLTRLLIPFEITSDYSVYSLLGVDVKIDSAVREDLETERTTGGRYGEILSQSVAAGQGASEQQSETAGQDTSEQRPETTGGGLHAQTLKAQNDIGEAKPAVAPDINIGINADANKGATQFGRIGSIISIIMTELVNLTNSMTAMIIWAVGAVLCAVFFIVTYVRCRIEFAMSLPVHNAFVEAWVEQRRVPQGKKFFSVWQSHKASHGICRCVDVRVSDRIDTPLTYGVIHPVILLPKGMEWEKTEQLEYVLWHEYMHIRYADSVLKLAVVTALSIHWFNPLVWVMYILLNRDIELACDESVVRRCGVDDRSAYANMLISMEAKRSGLIPLCNNFSQNAIEERVRAIMKIKKISLGAVIFAAGLVVGVTTAFATSSAGNAERTAALTNSVNDDMALQNDTESETDQTTGTKVADAGFTQEEYDKLMALRFDGYEDMTVSEFQDKVWALTDTPEYRDILERFSQSEEFYEKCDTDDRAAFMFNVLDPLTGDKWQERDFSGAVSVSGIDSPRQQNVPYDMAILEYVMTVTILDADSLTVGDYVDIRLELADRIANFLSGCMTEELADEELMQGVIDSMIGELTEALSTEDIRGDVEWVYRPLGSYRTDGSDTPEEGWDWETEYQRQQEEVRALEAEYQNDRAEQWEEVLKPYIPFGLTCEYDIQADEGKMYFQGKEVRGLMDEKRGIWITEHSGIGENIYAEDSIEVYAVYDEDGNLTGLRAATEEEQEEWNLKRRQSTDGWHDVSEEVREFLPGTNEDYDLMLSLKKFDYGKMSLADFNSALLAWGNEHSDSYDRIERDRIWDDFRVNLSEEDKEFVTRTVRLSGRENAMVVRSLYRGKTEEEAEDVSIGDTLTKNPGNEAPQLTWCQMYYSFRYHVSDKEKVTVGERDCAVGGMLDGIEDFWGQTDIEELLKMDKSDIIVKLNELAKKYSTRNITITVAKDDQIGFECMDERELRY